MNRLTDIFTNTGFLVSNYFLMPLLIWTAAAGILILFLRRTKRLSPDYHYYIRLAVLFSLPVGILGAILVEYVSGFFSEPSALAFVVFQNPVVASNSVGGATSGGIQITFWLGSAGFLLMLISTGKLFTLAAHHIKLLKWTRNLAYNSLQDLPPQYLLKNKPSTNVDMKAVVAFSNQATVPFTYGWIKPRIILPAALADQPGKVQMALQHEIRHIRQRDFLFHYISSIINSLFWFHPLTNLLHKSIQQYSEILCDTEVLAEHQPEPVSRKAYAELILEFATQTPEAPTAVNMASPKSSLKKRIAMISTTTQSRLNLRNSFLISFISAGLLVIAVSCTDIGNNGITNSEVEQVQSTLQTEQNDQQPVYIVNGEKWTSEKQKETLSRMKPEYIENIKVIKGDKAHQITGDAAENGVVQISIVNPEQAMKDLRDTDAASTRFTGEKDFYMKVENPPKLIGGLPSIQKHITYPEEARKQGIEGRVMVSFIVNEQGRVENAKVVRGIGGGCDEEAVRVVKKAEFEPGYQDGEPVRVKFMLPIHFKLSNTGSDNTTES